MLGGVMDIGHAILGALGYLVAVVLFSLLGGAVVRSMKPTPVSRRRDEPIRGTAADVADEEFQIF